MQTCRHLAIALFLLVVPCSAVDAQDSKPPFRISRETTYITQPVGDDGLIDYVEALSRKHREGVTQENNSVVMFRQALGRRDIPEKWAEEYFRQLGMEMLPKDGDYLIGETDYVVSLDDTQLPRGNGNVPDRTQLAFKQHGEALRHPWTRQEFPSAAGWIEKNEKPLDLVVRGSERSKYFYPLLPARGMVLTLRLPDASAARETARLLGTRAMLRLGEGDVESAWQDVLACHRIARLVAQSPTLIDMFVAIAVESIACGCDRQIAFSKLSAKQAKQFLNELRILGPVEGIADQLDTSQRFTYLESIGNIAVHRGALLDSLLGSEDSDEGRAALPLSFRQAMLKGDVDWNIVLQVGNESYDEMVKTARLPTRLERQRQLASLTAKLKQMKEKAVNGDFEAPAGDGQSLSEKFGIIMIAAMVPPFENACEAEDRSFMWTELSQCAFAMAAWKADHGDYPEHLEQMSPNYLPKIPIDIYTGKSLIYRRADSGYVLYGIGSNLKDDGGLTFGEGPDTDDLVVRTP